MPLRSCLSAPATRAVVVSAVLILGETLSCAPQQGEPVNQAQPQAVRKPRIPPPMFSGAYVEALRDMLELESEDAARLEARLATDPYDLAARLKLMAYHGRADRAGLAESRRRRAELMLWLVEHQPDSEILRSPCAAFQPGELSPDQFQHAGQLWAAAVKARPSDPAVAWNAAQFWGTYDRRKSAALLERAAELAPENAHTSLGLGLLYAGAILRARQPRQNQGPEADPHLAQRATQQLETTTNAALLEPAVKLLQSAYNASLMRGSADEALGQLAQRYFQRLKALNPEVDEAWVFPKIDPKMVGILAPGVRPPQEDVSWRKEAAGQIRRLRPEAFPELPRSVGAVLRQRGCLVPQPAPDGPPRNVIRGEFFAKGQAGWAVLCSAGGRSAILVFRHDADSTPELLARSEDQIYVYRHEQGKTYYLREIAVADRKFIMTHYRAYGGPEPPPIDHHGIDDSFLEKASITYYWHQRTWLRLQGAD